MSKPNYGRVTSRLLDAIAALNESATDAVSRADELAAFHTASAMKGFFLPPSEHNRPKAAVPPPWPAHVSSAPQAAPPATPEKPEPSSASGDAVVRLKAALAKARPELEKLGQIDDGTYRDVLLARFPGRAGATEAAIKKLAAEIQVVLCDFGDRAGGGSAVSTDAVRAALVERNFDEAQAESIVDAAKKSKGGTFSVSEFVRVVMVDASGEGVGGAGSLDGTGGVGGMADLGGSDGTGGEETQTPAVTYAVTKLKAALNTFPELKDCIGLIDDETYGALLLKCLPHIENPTDEAICGAGPDPTQVAALTAQNEELRKLIAKLEGELAVAMKMNDEVRRLKDMLSSADSSNEALASERDQERLRLQEVCAKAAALETDKKGLTAEKLTLREECNDLKMKIPALYEKTSTLEAKVRSLEAESGHATKKTQKLQEELQRAKADLEVEKTNADSYARSLQTALAEKINLQAEVAGLTGRLNDNDANATMPPDGEKVEDEEKKEWAMS